MSYVTTEDEISRSGLSINDSYHDYELTITVGWGHPLVELIWGAANRGKVFSVGIDRVFSDDPSDFVTVFTGIVLKYRSSNGAVEMTAGPPVSLDGFSVPRGSYTTRDWAGRIGEDPALYTAEAMVEIKHASDEYTIEIQSEGARFLEDKIAMGSLVYRGISTPILSSQPGGAAGSFRIELADFRDDLPLGDITDLVDIVSAYDGTLQDARDYGGGHLRRFSGFPYMPKEDLND